MPYNKPNIVIVGAGMAGLLNAIAIRNALPTANISIYEKATELKGLGGALMLWPTGIKRLRDLGLSNIVDALDVKINYTTFYDDENNLLYKGDLNKFYEKTGDSIITVERAKLQALLLKAAQERNIDIHLNHTYVDVFESTGTGTTVTFTNPAGKNIQVNADLVIAADGANSSIRQEKIQKEARLEYTGLCVWISILDKGTVDFPLDQTYFQPWHNAGVWICPLNDGRQGFYAYYRMEEKDFKPVEQGNKLAQLKVLYSDKINDQSPFNAQVLNAPENEHTYAGATYELKGLTTWISKGGRILLTGDAAHATSPTHGYNTSSAAEDAYVLMESIKLHQGNLVAAARGYERVRMPVAQKFMAQEAKDAKVAFTGDKAFAIERNKIIKTLDPNDPFSEWCALILDTTMEKQLAELKQPTAENNNNNLMQNKK